jgi:hypothetical protein
MMTGTKTLFEITWKVKELKNGYKYLRFCFQIVVANIQDISCDLIGKHSKEYRLVASTIHNCSQETVQN